MNPTLRFADEFRGADLGRGLAEEVSRLVAGPAGDGGGIGRGRAPGISIMEVCGGHTHALWRYGIPDMLPPEVRMVHGPGCPVCVLPTGRLDGVARLARDHPVTLCVYGDVLRVPGSDGSLLDARRRGADVRMVYSPLDALDLARGDPARQVVFWAIGFETTAPATAATLITARAEGIANFSVVCNHVRVIPALEGLLGDGTAPVDALIGPGHVAAVIGSAAFADFTSSHRIPMAVCGFEPADLLGAICAVVRQRVEGRCEVENLYRRVVRPEGNPRALALMESCFEVRDTFEWRGLGHIPRSAFALAGEWADFDAEARFAMDYRFVPDHRSCRCADVLTGRISPTECRVFGRGCTPETPLGSCMVSSEGACAAEYVHGGARRVAVASPRR